MKPVPEGRLRDEILHDSAATLRLVGEVLTDLGEDGPSALEQRISHAVDHTEISLAKLTALVRTLVVAHAELIGVVDFIGDNRCAFETVARSRLDAPHTADPEPSGGSDLAATAGDAFSIFNEIENRLREIVESFDPPILGIELDRRLSAAPVQEPDPTIPDSSGCPG